MNYIDASFEKITKYKDDSSIIIPTRKTANSAGYDFYAAEDVEISPYMDKAVELEQFIFTNAKESFKSYEEWAAARMPISLDDAAAYVKGANAKLTLVPTGIKCKIPENYYLQLSVRSSLPLKHWLIMGNSVGIIDADYYNNQDNEGHIYFQLINLAPMPIMIHKGDCFGQGILLPYYVCNGDTTDATRTGGFGSTNVQ